MIYCPNNSYCIEMCFGACAYETGDIMASQTKYGHPFFYLQTKDEEILHSAKNFDYAAGGDPLGNFKRVAAILALYPGLDVSDPAVVAMVYSLKQLDAVMWGLAKKIEHQVEGLHPRLQDIAVYAKIARCILQDTEQAFTGPKVTDVPPEVKRSTWQDLVR